MPSYINSINTSCYGASLNILFKLFLSSLLFDLGIDNIILGFSISFIHRLRPFLNTPYSYKMQHHLQWQCAILPLPSREFRERPKLSYPSSLSHHYFSLECPKWLNPWYHLSQKFILFLLMHQCTMWRCSLATVYLL